MCFVDIEAWERRDHYLFFKDFENPFFNICADVDITRTLYFTRDNQLSFFVAALYLSVKTANSIKEFRFRIRDEQVIVHEVVHPSSTVLNTDNTFSFCYFSYDADFSRFNQSAAEILKMHKKGFKNLTSEGHRDDLIYYSVIPWVSFTSFANPKQRGNKDSIPKIVFGKYFEDGKRIKMPVSVEVNHALVDGFHVGRFFEEFQGQLERPERSLNV